MVEKSVRCSAASGPGMQGKLQELNWATPSFQVLADWLGVKKVDYDFYCTVSNRKEQNNTKLHKNKTYVFNGTQLRLFLKWGYL